jgi:hypothetical protein
VLALVDDVETGGEPDDQRHRQDQSETETAGVRAATAPASAAEQTTEEAGELLLDVLHDTVDVGATGARLPALTPGILVPGLAWFIPCHD